MLQVNRFVFFTATFCSFFTLIADAGPCQPIAKQCKNSLYTVATNTWSNPGCIQNILLGKNSPAGISDQIIQTCVEQNGAFKNLFTGVHANGKLYVKGGLFSGLYSDGKQYVDGAARFSSGHNYNHNPRAPSNPIITFGTCEFIKRGDSEWLGPQARVRVSWTRPLKRPPGAGTFSDYHVNAQTQSGYHSGLGFPNNTATEKEWLSGTVPCDFSDSVRFEIKPRYINASTGEETCGDALVTEFTPIKVVNAAGVPTPPSNVTVTYERSFRWGNKIPATTVNLSWLAPGNEGDNRISNYVIQTRSGLAEGWSTVQRTSVSVLLNATFTEWECGVPYQFRVAAVNAKGLGDFSAPSELKSNTCVPSGPKFGRNRFEGDGQVWFDFFPLRGDDNGSPNLDYQVRYAPVVNGTAQTWVTLAKSQIQRIEFSEFKAKIHRATITGLQNGTTYTFEVSAVNAIGVGPSSSGLNLTPFGVPAKPTNLKVEPGANQVYLTWTPPAGNGKPIRGYSIRYSSDGGNTWNQPVQTDKPAYTYTGLLAGLSYTFKVAATNERGEGPSSDNSPPIVFTTIGDKRCEFNYELIGRVSCAGNDKRWDVRKRLKCSGCGGDMYGAGTYWFQGSYSVNLPSDAHDIEVQGETGIYSSDFNIVSIYLGKTRLEKQSPSQVMYNIDDRGRKTGYPSGPYRRESYHPFSGSVALVPGKNTFTLTVNPIGCIWDNTQGDFYLVYDGRYGINLKGHYRALQCNPALEGTAEDPSGKAQYFQLMRK